MDTPHLSPIQLARAILVGAENSPYRISRRGIVAVVHGGRERCVSCDAQLPPGRDGRQCKSCRTKPSGTIQITDNSIVLHT